MGTGDAHRTHSGPEEAKAEILAHVAAAGSASVTELAGALARPRSTVAKQVASLVQAGHLQPTEPSSSPRQRYRVP